MSIETPDITAVMTTHGEGALAAVSFNNFIRTVEFAESAGLRIEKVVVMDRPEDHTRRIFEDLDDQSVRIMETDFGDQGRVRNFVAEHSFGKYIAFLDGDDLWSENWLSEAFTFLESDSRDNLIAHPEFNWFFSGTGSVIVNTDQESELFDEQFLRYANYWDAMCMTLRATHVSIPYCKRQIKAGFAFEDWHWNCETIAAGYIHKVIKDTIHFKRRRTSSQTTQASANRSSIPATPFTNYSRWAA